MKNKTTKKKSFSSIRGNIYITNDSLFSDDNYKKSGRRVVVVNNNPNKAHIMKIKGLTDNNGKERKNMISIGNYKCLTKPSGIYKKVYWKTGKINNKRHNIDVKKMKKTNCKLHNEDMKKIKNYK